MSENTTESGIIVPAFEGLTFDEGPHIYRLNGLEIPSVSTIIKPLSNAEYSGISKATLDRAAEKGSAVHNAIENWIKFEIEDIPAEHYGYFAAFLDWFRYRQPKIIGSEIRMYHKILRYAGTCDLLCQLGDKLSLIDYKTTYGENAMTWGVQLEAYLQALASHGLKVDQKIILHLKKDATWKELFFPSPDAQRWRVFGACKTVYDYTSSCK